MARTSARGAVKDEKWAKPAAQGRQANEIAREEERKRAAREPHRPKGQEEQARRRGKREAASESREPAWERQGRNGEGDRWSPIQNGAKRAKHAREGVLGQHQEGM